MLIFFNVLIIAVTIAVAAYLAFSKKLAQSANWSATVTPLASIMGSGFLVSAPLLAGIVGYAALPCMCILLLLAYAVGSAIRFNIRNFEPIEHKHGTVQSTAFLSRLVLAGAYFISVSYYLQLLSTFVLSQCSIDNDTLSSAITSGILLLIAAVGMWRGLHLLEKVEKYAVSINLAVIAALLLALIYYNCAHLLQGSWHLPAVESQINFKDFRVLLGLLIVVQGFETSRYLGDEHPPEQRIKTMRAAQLIASAIYIIFIGLITILFQSKADADVTAIITMVTPVAAVLPILLIIAAIGSQFSAAVADYSGAGGLTEDITNHRIPERYAYGIILLITIFITWESNVNEIIAYASRAFALYYFLQCVVAAWVAAANKDINKRYLKCCGFALMALLCLSVCILGIPAESS